MYSIADGENTDNESNSSPLKEVSGFDLNDRMPDSDLKEVTPIKAYVTLNQTF
jgi:hypothetical protein